MNTAQQQMLRQAAQRKHILQQLNLLRRREKQLLFELQQNQYRIEFWEAKLPPSSE